MSRASLNEPLSWGEAAARALSNSQCESSRDGSRWRCARPLWMEPEKLEPISPARKISADKVVPVCSPGPMSPALAIAPKDRWGKTWLRCAPTSEPLMVMLAIGHAFTIAGNGAFVPAFPISRSLARPYGPRFQWATVKPRLPPDEPGDVALFERAIVLMNPVGIRPPPN